MPAWNAWYHVTVNTYGTWIPGDPRGWHTRHSRIQPGANELGELDASSLLAHSKRTLSRDAVVLSPEARRLARDTIVAALLFHDLQVIACAVDDHHAHILSRFPDDKPRHWIGIAKKESARALSRAALATPGGIWAVRSHCDPIQNRDHQLDAFNYIARHADRQAAIWLANKHPPPPPLPSPRPSPLPPPRHPPSHDRPS